MVCLNGVGLYESVIQRHRGVRGQAFTNPTMRKDFAEGVIKTLKRNRPESLVSGLVRVDIMWSTYLNKMIVIELESLEACHYPTYFDFDVQSQMHNYLGVYYANNIISCLEKLLHIKIPSLDYPFISISKIYEDDLSRATTKLKLISYFIIKLIFETITH